MVPNESDLRGVTEALFTIALMLWPVYLNAFIWGKASKSMLLFGTKLEKV